MLRSCLLAVAALGLAACATQDQTQAASAPPADRDCFPASTASGFNYLDERHIVVTAAGRRYALTTMFNARDLDWTQAIAIRSTTNWICTGNGLGVEIIGGDPQRTYPVTAVERLPEPANTQGS